MSDDERSGSGSDSEDLETSGLIATRQKRATAGNLYATLRANLDDEELQKELLAEDEEEDAGDYEGSDKDGDDDDALESSSDEEDAGPPKDGEQEDLEGEKALKKQERAEARKKRKVHEAKLKLPAWRQKKKVKLADDAKTEDGNTSERPKKKSERSNWLPTPADAPVRQSGRALAVENREIVHANLKKSAERSEKQRKVMKHAAEREKTKRRMEGMSQEERLKKCERIERETAREFGRWEREEAERQRLRDEALAAKRNRGLDGPVVRHWSGSVMWEGDRIKVRRMSHGSRKVDEVEANGIVDLTGSENQGPSPATLTSKPPAEASPGSQVQGTPHPAPIPAPAQPNHPLQAATLSTPDHNASLQTPVPWLQGIQEYAAQPETTPSHPPAYNGYTLRTPGINGTAPPPAQPTASYPQQPQPTYPPPPPQPQFYHGWPPGSHQFALHPQPPPPPPAPLIREQAQRTLILLSQFPTLETPPTKRIPKYKQHLEIPLDPNPLTSILLPSSFPPSGGFTPEEQKYLLARPRKRGNEIPLPAPPPKQRCAVTSWPAKFRDPKTGLAYADLHQYKVIQRLLAGGCQWSGLLGCLVGPSYGVMGRAARGVPEGFTKRDGGGSGSGSGSVVKVEG